MKSLFILVKSIFLYYSSAKLFNYDMIMIFFFHIEYLTKKDGGIQR